MRCDKYTREGLKTMAEHQLNILLEKGRCVDEVKAEWYRRWGLEWPYIRTISGVEEYRHTFQRR